MGQRCDEIVEMGRSGLLGPDLTLIHCNAMPEEGWQRIADAGTKITLATTSEQQLGLGDGVPVIQEALDHGIEPCLSGDVEVCLAGDMFTQMRVTLNTQRMLAKARKYRGDNKAPALISHRDVIAYTTRNAAVAVGLGDEIGTLSPGKYADLIAIRAEDLNNMPVNNAIGTIVSSTENANIDMVFVAGRLRKWQGKVLGVELNALRTLVKDSRDYISSRVGFEIHPTQHIHLKHDEIRHRHAGNFDSISDLLDRGT
jgi:cytosine/adenosine deaminase-related metal-dependent hydrolase